MLPHYPEITYQNRIAANEALAEKWARLDARISNARVIVFVMIAATAAIAHSVSSISFAWTILPILVFLALIIYHARVIQHLQNALNSITFYNTGLDRIHDRWMGKGDSGDSWHPNQHFYADDLDIFGEGSLFQLLNTTRTQIGASTLATWLTHPADIQSIQQRQEAVDELRDNLELREQIALTAREIQSDLHPIRLQHWAEGPITKRSALQIWLPRILTAISLVCFALLFRIDFTYSYLPFMISFIVNMIVLRSYTKTVTPITQKIDGALRDLQLFMYLAELFEKQAFKSQLLLAHQKRLISGDHNASAAIKKLTTLFTWMELNRNQMFYPFGIMCLWIVHFTFMIENWRAEHGSDISKWTQSLGEIEVLCALAAYAYEHPSDPFPDFLESEDPRIAASEMRHPLLPAVDCVANPIELNETNSLLIVSGSNMSGKSTYLRTIGINVVLAMMGAPVRCATLRMTPLVIGASIQVKDSIQTGVSHFYAEILRLKAITQLTEGDTPVLFLIDEILHGTNSHDRKIGTQAVVEQLLNTSSIGLITTHDLALTTLETSHQTRTSNIHFQDLIKGDQLFFDYKVRPGIIEKSNALALMRSIGLKVD